MGFGTDATSPEKDKLIITRYEKGPNAQGVGHVGLGIPVSLQAHLLDLSCFIAAVGPQVFSVGGQAHAKDRLRGAVRCQDLVKPKFRPVE